ncbi:hypothetical protein CSA37_05870 [Candidatus Fermentibacteria bacterium]|nr:MAG: hypothetical protein CSA37_05870 [Candidatus Fermentibacteria bacterium]
MADMLQFAFMRNAILLTVLASVSCGIIGSLITANRMSSFIGSIAHASFGGLGLAYLAGVDPVLGATVFALGSSLGMGFLSRRREILSSGAMAVMWASGMALGLVLIKISGTYNADLMSWLFGSLMSVSKSDILITASLGAVALVMVLFLYRELLGISWDIEFARLQGVRVRFVRALFLSASALAVIVLMKVSGLIMVIALLTVPASIASRFSRSLKGMMVRSSLLSLLFGLSGLWASWHLDLPSGPVIILISALAYSGAAVFSPQN